MKKVCITGTGIEVPQESISNEELVASYNQYVENYNSQHQQDILSGSCVALQPSSTEFIEKASGITSRYVLNKQGILDPDIMCPLLPERSDDELGWQAEMAVNAAKKAMQAAGVEASALGACIAACSNFQRAYPAVAIEVQQALGIEGQAYDMNVACSSATFALQAAYSMIVSGQADKVLVVSPEICSAHLEWRDRDCHFIFGDVATAVILESVETTRQSSSFVIHSMFAKTQYSNNIRNNFGFLNRCSPETRFSRDKTFFQHGRKVFKEVVPWVSDLLQEHLSQHQLEAQQIKRFWLHQANINMNHLICKRLLNEDPDPERVPVILNEYANTSSAGSILAFHMFNQGFEPDDIGLLCSFGAGYSVGCLLVEYQQL